MGKIHNNFSLKFYNTFGVDVRAKYFAEVYSDEEFCTIVLNPRFVNIPKLILGEGSNILFTKDFEGIVIHPVFRGINRIEETDEYVLLEVETGENWDDFVSYAVVNGYGGIENLSLIPGSVGACPIQNIGAYGVEVRDVIEQVKTLSITDCSEKIFLNEDCKFGYRNSIFKTELKNKYMVTSVRFRLNKKPALKLHYENIKEELEKFDEINLKTIREAIISIRQRKLPDPELLGNAGSFFKNPILKNAFFECLQKEYGSIPSYKISDSEQKIAAGWLIEKCGWKGKKFGNAGVHDKQSLVLVNLNSASGEEIFQLSEQIRLSVKKKFGVDLEREVNVV